MGVWIFLAIVVLIGGGTLAYLWMEMSKQWRAEAEAMAEARRLFRPLLARELRLGNLSQFSLGEFAERCDIPYPEARKVGRELFDLLLKKVYEDDVVTDKERRQLDMVIKALDVEHRDAIRAEQDLKEGRYREAVSEVPADGVISAEEAGELARLRQSLGLSGDEARLAAEDLSNEAYLDLLRRIVEGGSVTPQQLAYLKDVKNAIHLNSNEAREELDNDLMTLYRRAVTLILSDGEVTDEELRLLKWLKEESRFSDEDVDSFDEQIERSFGISSIRRGNLPTIRTRKMVASGEICHFEGDCSYTHKTPSGKVNDYDGELLVTSKKITFISDEKSFEFSPSKIVDISMEKRNAAVFIKTSNNRGSGTYDVEYAEELEAILSALVRNISTFS